MISLKRPKVSLSSALRVLSTSTWFTSAGWALSWPAKTSPVLPSMEMKSSPALRVMLPTLTVRLATSMFRVEAPQTQGLPMPRATTAAWEVMPPRAVRMPLAATMPARSSGEVSMRTRTTGPLAGHLLGLLGGEGDAARGGAGTGGEALGHQLAVLLEGGLLLGVEDGGQELDEVVGVRCASGRSCSSIMPSLTMSMAMRMPARAVRLPLRVWSM